MVKGTTHPSETYASQLSGRGHGYPLWCPDGPSDNSNEIEIGDVGYIREGAFVEIFNPCFPRRDPRNRKKDLGPRNYEILKYNPVLLMKRTNYIPAGVLSSRSVETKTIAATAGGEMPAGPGAKMGFEYSVQGDQGASLRISCPATKQWLDNGQSVSKYVKENHSKWVTHVRDVDGITVSEQEMIFVSGTVKTVDWTVAAGSSGAVAKHAIISAQAGSQAGLLLELEANKQQTNSVEFRYGPDSRALMPALPALDVHKSDQCIFLRFYKVKWRLGIFKTVMEAGAGPHQLPPPDRMGDSNDVVATADFMTDEEEIESNDPVISVDTDLDALLDYILGNSQAEVAIACHDDVDSLVLGIDRPPNFVAFLHTNKPVIHVDENSVGTLDLVELLRKERLWDITSIPPLMAGIEDVMEDFNPDSGQDDCNGSLASSELTLGSQPDKPIKWPHLMLKDKELDEGPVSSTALSPDGTLIAATYKDSVVRLWKAKDGALVKFLESHGDVVYSVSFSPDSLRLVGGSAEKTVLVWDVTARDNTKPVMALEGHQGEASVAVYSPNGKYIASGSMDCSVKIWDAESGICLRTCHGHLTNLMHLAFTADSSRLISSAEALGRIWDVESGRKLGTIEGHGGSIWALVVSHAGDRVITASEDRTCRIWDSTNGTELVTIAEHTSAVWSVAWSPDDKAVVSGSYDAAAIVSDSYSGDTIHQLSRDGNAALSDALLVNWSPVGDVVCTGIEDGHVNLWDAQSGTLIADYRGHQDKVNQVTFSFDGRDVFSSSDDGSVRKWSVSDAVRLY